MITTWLPHPDAQTLKVYRRWDGIPTVSTFTLGEDIWLAMLRYEFGDANYGAWVYVPLPLADLGRLEELVANGTALARSIWFDDVEEWPGVKAGFSKKNKLVWTDFSSEGTP